MMDNRSDAPVSLFRRVVSIGGWVMTPSTSRYAFSLSVVLLSVLIGWISDAPAPASADPAVLPAFPGAEGHGAESIGGRGGWVIEVTNLNDSGPGSLREAAEASGPRIIVFRVAGTIEITSDRINVSNPFVTIAGQTAPGDGITLSGLGVRVSTHDVIIRYLRWRSSTFQFITLAPDDDLHNVIIDHCSANGGGNNRLISGGYYSVNPVHPDFRKITVQKCLLAESGGKRAMNFGAFTDLAADPPILNHLRVYDISVHDNYFVHNSYRNPKMRSQNSEIINNVVFNWGIWVTGTHGSTEVDFINNYWKSGPMSQRERALIFENHDEQHGILFPLSSNYISGNIIPSWGVDDPDQDNWFLFETFEERWGEIGNPVPEDNRRFTPLSPAPIPVTIEPALQMYESVVLDAGANSRVTADGSFVDARDEIDQVFIDDFFNGTGPTSPPTVFVFSSFAGPDPGVPYDDSDHDGMADDWENLYGFDPNDDSDGPQDADGDGYTNVEEFLNGTSALVSDVLDTTPPTLLDLPSSVTLELTDPDGAVYSYAPLTAVDDVDPAPSVSCSPASGFTFPLGTTTATCTATDFSGNSSGGSFVVTVVNAVPQVSVGPRASIDEGDVFAGSAVITDPGGDTWMLPVDYGDGTPQELMTATATAFVLSHAYPKDGTFAITLSATDADGAVGATSLELIVNHVWPTLPGQTQAVRDLDGDGLAEDANGNGVLDFGDVLTLFDHMDSGQVQGNPSDFDFSLNGSVDFADIDSLFDSVVS